MRVIRAYGQQILEVLPAVLLLPHVHQKLDLRFASFAGMYRLAQSAMMGDTLIYAGVADGNWVGMIWVVKSSGNTGDAHISWSRGHDALLGVRQAEILAKSDGIDFVQAQIPIKNRVTNLLAKRAGFTLGSVSGPVFMEHDGKMSYCNTWLKEL